MKKISLILMALAAFHINITSVKAVNNKVKISANNQSQSQINSIKKSDCEPLICIDVMTRCLCIDLERKIISRARWR